MSIRMRLREERAQATVEMAVVTPVLLVLALIVYNVMIFASAVARFDRVVPDIVLAHAVASEGEGDESSADASATVQTQILNAMEGYGLQIEVSSEQGAEASDGGLLSLSGTFRTYTCTMHYEPWPTSLSIAGVPLGAPTTLSHERAVTVDPWRPTSPTRGHSTGWVGRRPSLRWRSRLSCACAACWDGVRLPPTACRSSWRFHAALRSIRVLWPIPSTSPSSIATAISSSATKAFVLGARAPAPAPGPY